MKKYIFLVILVITTSTFSGCWDSRELNELGLVMAVGIDKSKDNEGYEVSVQVARPKDAGGAPSGGGTGEPIWVGSARGDTIFDAIRNIAMFSSRRIMWAHNNVIIIGESLAEEGITPIVDFFTHNPELRMKTWVAVTRGEAKTYISANTGMETIPAVSIARLYLYNELPSKSVRTDMVRLFRDYKSETIHPIVSVLSLTPRKLGSGSDVELGGGAIFKKDKLVGWLSPEETRGIGWIRGEVKRSIVSVVCAGMGDKKVAVELDNIKVKIITKIEGDVPNFTINVTAKGSIAEQDASSGKSIEEFKNEAERLVEEKIEKEIKTSVEKVQKDFDSDVLGLGRMLHIQHKREWNSGLKEKWPELFPKAVIEVNANVDIHMSELFQIPIKEEHIEGETDNED